MPAPMMTPMPKTVRSRALSVLFSLWSASSDEAIEASTDLVRNTLMLTSERSVTGGSSQTSGERDRLRVLPGRRWPRAAGDAATTQWYPPRPDSAHWEDDLAGAAQSSERGQIGPVSAPRRRRLRSSLS